MSTFPSNPADDVRMRGFTRRDTVDFALTWLDSQLQCLDAVTVPLSAAAGRVLAGAVVSGVDVPMFDRAMMDGYAVVAASTTEASDGNPQALQVIGEAMPGRAFQGAVGTCEAVRIMTGAPMPTGADAVLPAELVDSAGPRIHARAAVSPKTHVGWRGEDVSIGTTLFEAGRRLRPQDLGVLSSVGVGQVSVVRQPCVRIVVTGNELLPAGSQPRDCQIVDANGPMLTALAARDGGVVDYPGIVPDDRDPILAALQSKAEVVIVSGGSSVGSEDFVPTLLAEHGELAIHGLAMRPSSPLGMGRLGNRLVFLLPGNPVSCLCGYDFFAGRAIRALGGRSKTWPYRAVQATVAKELKSSPGRVDYLRVRLIGDQVEPVRGGSSVLSSTTRADGFVIIEAEVERHTPGEQVTVWKYASED